jgi:16S rRNA (cytosine967-C5)-methyltransferase
MKYALQYLKSAITIIRKYDGSIPLAAFLKQYFAADRKYGSKDRKNISQLCYTYYRLGHALRELAEEERLKVALFLCSDSAGEWEDLYEDSWITNWSSDLQARIDFVRWAYPGFSVKNIFPWIDELSEGIDTDAFVKSHFIQPDLFLRIRPGKENAVLQKLDEHSVPFTQTGNCLALPNSTKADTILAIDDEAVIQDLSSQRIAEFLALITSPPPLTVWDCCAASGGKSLLAYDVLPGVSLTVSDIRPAIIQNLKKRFERAGIKNYKAFVNDAANYARNIHHSGSFNIVVCDAPCTGSGTWGRTPEQLYFFTAETISQYASLQKKILAGAIPAVAAGGYLLYITCSVFQKENEEIASFIQTHTRYGTGKDGIAERLRQESRYYVRCIVQTPPNPLKGELILFSKKERCSFLLSRR